MIRRPPLTCYYYFTNEVKQLGVNSLKAIAELIHQTLNVTTSLPEGIKLKHHSALTMSYGMMVRGGYDPFDNEIKLYNDAWCRKTLIHEVLHALSYFYRERELINKSLTDWRPVVDGLNEFFTGLILYITRKEHPSCYDHWLEKSFIQCRISYEEAGTRVPGLSPKT